MPDSLKHLLLVEDEAPLRQAIAEQLGDRGYQVQQAESGEAALAQLADFAFDIIVTDLRLPGIDGSAVIEAAVARYPLIIAIVVTGFGTVKDDGDDVRIASDRRLDHGGAVDPGQTEVGHDDVEGEVREMCQGGLARLGLLDLVAAVAELLRNRLP